MSQPSFSSLAPSLSSSLPQRLPGPAHPGLQAQCPHTGGVVTNSRPVIVTYHDLGLNYVSNFQAFFNYPDFKVSSSSRTMLVV